MGERIAVVILQRRQGEQRRPVLRDFLYERVHYASAGIRIGHPVQFRAVPQRARDRHRVVVQAPAGGDVANGGGGLASLFELQAADPDVFQVRKAGRGVRRGGGGPKGLYQLRQLGRLDTLVDHNALDAELLQLPRQLAHQAVVHESGELADGPVGAPRGLSVNRQGVGVDGEGDVPRRNQPARRRRDA